MWLAFLFFQLNADPCRPQERTLFQCVTQGRVFALCASAELTPEKGYVQYRGFDANYPTGQELPVRNFEFWMDQRGTGVTFGVRGVAHELYSEGSHDRVTMDGIGRFACERSDHDLSLGSDATHDFLRSAGLLR